MVLFSALTGEAPFTIGKNQSRHTYLVTVLRLWTARWLALKGTSIACTVMLKKRCGREGMRNVRMGNGKDKYGTLSSVHSMVTANMNTQQRWPHVWDICLFCAWHGHSKHEHSAVVATCVRPMSILCIAWSQQSWTHSSDGHMCETYAWNKEVTVGVSSCESGDWQRWGGEMRKLYGKMVNIHCIWVYNYKK